jgi:multidrug efflux pump subunit AcrA (membrane-fusion protein)
MKVEVTDPQFKLKGGMFANVSIAAGRKQGTLVVPREAVVGREPDAAVYAVVDGRYRRQPVQVGLHDGRMIEILSGLSDGAEVVLSPTALRDGDTTR